MTAQSEQSSPDAPPRSHLALALRVLAATLIVTTTIPFAVLLGLMLFPILPLLVFPFAVGLIGAAAGAKANGAGPRRAAASIPVRAAAPQAAHA
jgi:hypothetical protein